MIVALMIMNKLINKYFKWGHYHVFECHTCYEMERRGYTSEAKYWDDFFHYKEKPIKYRLVKVKPERKIS
jgi:hypothetical protein